MTFKVSNLFHPKKSMVYLGKPVSKTLVYHRYKSKFNLIAVEVFNGYFKNTQRQRPYAQKKKP